MQQDWATKRVIGSYLVDADFDLAIQLCDALDKHATDYDAYLVLVNMIIDSRITQITDPIISEEQIGRLQEYASGSDENSFMAKSILNLLQGTPVEPDLCAIYGYCDAPEERRAKEKSQEGLKAQSEFYALALPNPASDWIEIKYFVPSQIMNPNLTITDLLGREVFKIGLNSGAEDVIAFNSESLSPGVYFYQLSSGSMLFCSKMIQVIK